jgi:hypothetical protein
MRKSELPAVEEVGRPAALPVGTIIRSCLDETNRAARFLRQASSDDATRSPSACDDDIEAHLQIQTSLPRVRDM